MIGGWAFGAFAEQLIEKLPEGTIGILGEGEEAVLKMVEGKPLDGERFIARQNGKSITGTGQSYTGLDDLSVDLPYITEIFPQYTAYTDDCIGVQSKRGCPYDCAFCLYPYLEGKSVRYRPAARVVNDIAQHYRQLGTRQAGFKGKVILNYSLNAPEETEATLRDSIESYKRVAAILGEDRVFPMMFFLGIQPHTDLEARLLEEGYLTSGYNPLVLSPSSIRKMLYNPAPLNKLIGKACLAAWNRKTGSRTGSRDPRPWSGALANPSPALDVRGSRYADASLLRGVELNSGRDVLLTLEPILNTRKSLAKTVASTPS